MTKIVIVGAGFGGLQAALHLEKRFSLNKNVEITLIDKRDYHLFTSNLYEVASSEEELTSISQMEKSVTVPIAEILTGKNITFLQAEVKEILPKEKKVFLATKKLDYDYLILALGSQSDFFNIAGAEKYSLTLKSLPDALRIRNQVEFEVQSHMYDVSKKTVRIVVAGGGYTGLELATELKGLLDILALKYQYPREKMEIEVIEANNKVIAGFDDRLSVDAYDRLLDLQIRPRLSARITEVDEHFVSLLSGEKVAYDVLVWTTGVKACPINSANVFTLDAKGRLPVNGFFQVQNFNEVFALGDNAGIMDSKSHPVPATSQDAWHEARYLAYALPYIMQNQKPPRAYEPKKHGFIVALGGKWAIMSYNNIYLKGFIAYVVDQFAHIRYYASIVGYWKAVRYILFQVKVYSRND
jgi:NADH dehydrogenase